jgi:hypothetical protein
LSRPCAVADIPLEAQEEEEPRSAQRLLSPPVWLPDPPRTLDEVDVPESLILDLAIRHVSVRGTCSIEKLSQVMKLPLELTEGIFRRLNEQQYFEVRRMAGDDYIFSLSPGGKRMAAERAQSSRYTGPAPVSLKSWTAAVRTQIARVEVTRERLRRAFSDIVVGESLLDALGPALISQNAIFLHGPSGTGKTTVAERLMRVFDDAITVPWAVEVDGQVILVADPAIHQRVTPGDLEGSDSLSPAELHKLDIDPRWVICRRPFVAVGGELVTSMLDLQKDDLSGAFTAPLQMKANNGMLLIDDFGRQMISPRDLLNRWIVPLDRRVDFLSLGSGAKFDIPFELQVVFSTNLAPHELADEAFLRRIPNKILLDAATPAQFDEIFRMNAAALGMRYAPGIEPLLREMCLKHSPDLRPCYPRDICNAIRAIAIYERRRIEITAPDVERAVAGYFI